jgi:hypothetical protein
MEHPRPGPADIAVHPMPLWRDRATFLIFADIAEDNLSKRWEQLWVRRVSDARFVLCCIPFFVYDLALGDEVETAPTDGKRYVVQRVTHTSGNFTYRVWFGQSSHPTIKTEVLAEVNRLGALPEWSSPNLRAINTDAASAQAMADWLWQRMQQEHLLCETGRTR